MAKYECPCGYVYDPKEGDPANGVEALKKNFLKKQTDLFQINT